MFLDIQQGMVAQPAGFLAYQTFRSSARPTLDDEEDEIDVDGASAENNDEGAQDEEAADSNATSQVSTPAPTSSKRERTFCFAELYSNSPRVLGMNLEKRKASEAHVKDGSRGAKRAREESEAADEADSPGMISFSCGTSVD